MSQCLGKINCKTLEFELEIDFDSLWQGYCTSPHFFFNTYSQGVPQIVKTQVVVKLRHTLRHSTCISMSFGIIEPHKILGEGVGEAWWKRDGAAGPVLGKWGVFISANEGAGGGQDVRGVGFTIRLALGWCSVASEAEDAVDL